MAVYCWVLAIFSSTIFIGISAQIPIPSRPLGFVYDSGKADAPIQFDVYMDPLCPDSRNAFPTIKEVAEFYGPDKVRLKMNFFPLPYHRNAYVVTQAIHAVDVLSDQFQTYNFTRHVYDNLNELGDDGLAEQEVIAMMAVCMGKFDIQKEQFEAMITRRAIDQDCRTEFKHGCTRGVAETPTFMINDIKVKEASPTWTLNNWRILIDELLKPRTNLYNQPSQGPSNVATGKCKFLALAMGLIVKQMTYSC